MAMKFFFSFDRTSKVVFTKEIDLKKDRFFIPKPLRLRLFRNASILLVLPIIAYYFEQMHMVWFSLLWTAAITGWQALAYGYSPKSFLGDELSPTKIYGRGPLIFLVIFWSVLIVSVSIALYLKLP